jgi:hypothetical protein
MFFSLSPLIGDNLDSSRSIPGLNIEGKRVIRFHLRINNRPIEKSAGRVFGLSNKNEPAQILYSCVEFTRAIRESAYFAKRLANKSTRPNLDKIAGS